MRDVGTLEIGEFQGREGEVFRAVLPEGGEPHELELREVSSMGERDPGGRRARRRPFSLLFRGPREPLVPQCLRRLEHPQLGDLDLFLVPIDQDEGGTIYEAVFT